MKPRQTPSSRRYFGAFALVLSFGLFTAVTRTLSTDSVVAAGAGQEVLEPLDVLQPGPDPDPTEEPDLDPVDPEDTCAAFKASFGQFRNRGQLVKEIVTSAVGGPPVSPESKKRVRDGGDDPDAIEASVKERMALDMSVTFSFFEPLAEEDVLNLKSLDSAEILAIFASVDDVVDGFALTSVYLVDPKEGRTLFEVMSDGRLHMDQQLKDLKSSAESADNVAPVIDTMSTPDRWVVGLSVRADQKTILRLITTNKKLFLSIEPEVVRAGAMPALPDNSSTEIVRKENCK